MATLCLLAVVKSKLSLTAPPPGSAEDPTLPLGSPVEGATAPLEASSDSSDRDTEDEIEKYANTPSKKSSS